jgi:galactose mutarotase-like enzyme
MAGQCLTRVAKENVLIQAGDCTVALLPQFGGKIASICVKNRELLHAPLTEIAPRTRTMAFDEGDASGWDECLPSVAACTVKTNTGVAEIPDHGDLWRVEWDAAGNREHGTGNRAQDNHAGAEIGRSKSITLRGECFSLPLALDRTLTLTESAKGWHLLVNYMLTNTGKIPAPWSWAAHPLWAVDAGDIIELPESITALRVEGSGGGRLGVAGDQVAWPVAKRAKGGLADLSVAQSRRSRFADKLFAGPLAADENWCALLRPQAGLRIRFSFDTATMPYLGLWLCYGGWPERRGAKQMCVAMEPSTAPVDSLAKTGEWSRVLGAGEHISWQMRVDIEIV